jgi:hypothetical protein
MAPLQSGLKTVRSSTSMSNPFVFVSAAYLWGVTHCTALWSLTLEEV